MCVGGGGVSACACDVLPTFSQVQDPALAASLLGENKDKI